MSDLTLYNFEQMPVRITMRDGEPWFLAQDLALVLGYSATAAMTRSLDDDEKGVQIVHTPGGDQEQIIISESGLYAAILKSRRPEAKRFRRWVTGEVLPAIRRTGRYDGVQRGERISVSDRISLYLEERQVVRLEDLCDDLGLSKDSQTKAAVAAMMRLAGWQKCWVKPREPKPGAIQLRRIGA